MKNIKRLGITTKEGFEVRNLQRFPSMEFGEEGGLQADLYYKGKHIMGVFQEGRGGCAMTYPTDFYKTHRFELEKECLNFLKRVDKSYGPDSPYDWLRNKKVRVSDNSKPQMEFINDDDWEAVVINIEEYYGEVKSAAKSFRAGYKAVACLKSDIEIGYLQYKVADVTEQEVRDFLKRNGLEKYTEVKILLPTPELSIL